MTRRLPDARRVRPSAPTRRPRPRCAEAEHLWAYLDDELPAGRARAVASHVGTCAVCGARARRLRAMLEACREAGCQRLPGDVRARARKRVRALLAAVPAGKRTGGKAGRKAGREKR